MGDALSNLKRHPDAVLVAGGTTFFGDESFPPLPDRSTILSLHGIRDLSAISRTDRYVEVGAMTPLSDLLSLKEGFIPEALRKTLKGIGNFAVRNLATIGGNLLAGGGFGDSFPVLASMDALAEFRQATSSRWMNLNRLISEEGAIQIPSGELLTRMRIPLTEWNINVVQKFGSRRRGSDGGALFVFLARTDKRVLSDFRTFFLCDRALRNRPAETALAGRKLPLSSRDIELTLNAYASSCRLAELPEPQSSRFLSLVRKSLTVLNEGTAV